MKPMTPRESRLVAVALLLAAILLPVFAIILPIVDGFSARSGERALLLATYARNERVIAGGGAWADRAGEQRRGQARYMLAAPSREQALDALRSRVSAALGGADGTLRSMQALDAEPGWLRLRADARLGLTALVEGLRRLAAQEPLLVIESLTVGADEAFASGLPGALDVQIEVRIRHADAPAR